MVQLIKSGEVYTTKQASVSDRKYRAKTRRMVEVANIILPLLKQRMALPDDVKVVVAFTRAKRNLGSYYPDKKECFIDPRRQGLWQFVDCVVHELTHAEQYHTGRLKQQYSRVHESWVPVWQDEEWGRWAGNFKKYREQPWEVEARKVAADLTKEIRASGLLDSYL